MSMMMSARLRLADEGGITLAELLVAMSMMAVVMLVFTNTLASVQRTVVEEQVRSDLNDQARLVLQTLDRQVRSGNLLYDPADESEDPVDAAARGFMFRVYTQAQYGGGDDARCVLWLLDGEQRLLSRSWPEGSPDDVTATGWRVVATGVVNRAIDPSGAVEPAFDLAATGRTIDVQILMNPDLEHRPEATQAFGLSLTGRNTSFGYPATVCENLPSDLSI